MTGQLLTTTTWCAVTRRVSAHVTVNTRAAEASYSTNQDAENTAARSEHGFFMGEGSSVTHCQLSGNTNASSSRLSLVSDCGHMLPLVVAASLQLLPSVVCRSISVWWFDFPCLCCLLSSLCSRRLDGDHERAGCKKHPGLFYLVHLVHLDPLSLFGRPNVN